MRLFYCSLCAAISFGAACDGQTVAPASDRPTLSAPAEALDTGEDSVPIANPQPPFNPERGPNTPRAESPEPQPRETKEPVKKETKVPVNLETVLRELNALEAQLREVKDNELAKAEWNKRKEAFFAKWNNRAREIYYFARVVAVTQDQVVLSTKLRSNFGGFDTPQEWIRGAVLLPSKRAYYRAIFVMKAPGLRYSEKWGTVISLPINEREGISKKRASRLRVDRYEAFRATVKQLTVNEYGNLHLSFSDLRFAGLRSQETVSGTWMKTGFADSMLIKLEQQKGDYLLRCELCKHIPGLGKQQPATVSFLQIAPGHYVGDPAAELGGIELSLFPTKEGGSPQLKLSGFAAPSRFFLGAPIFADYKSK